MSDVNAHFRQGPRPQPTKDARNRLDERALSYSLLILDAAANRAEYHQRSEIIPQDIDDAVRFLTQGPRVSPRLARTLFFSGTFAGSAGIGLIQAWIAGQVALAAICFVIFVVCAAAAWWGVAQR
jgi:hypothetical protein